MENVMTKEEKKKRTIQDQSYWGSVFFIFRKNKLAMVSLVMLVLIVAACIFVPVLSSHDIVTTNVDNANMSPSAQHWLGTDELGRDMFVRFFYAGRISMGIALVATVLICIIGVVLGGLSGYYGKFADTVIMRLCEIIMSLPFLMMCIMVVGLFGASIPTLITVLVVMSWPMICRIVRGQILSLRDLEYMQACEALGLSDAKRIFRHLLPNVMAYVIVYGTLSMASVILTETALSFLGLGISPPTPSWGGMIQAARNPVVLVERPWFWIPPGIAIFMAVMCFNLIGDGLRDAIDPKMKR